MLSHNVSPVRWHVLRCTSHLYFNICYVTIFSFVNTCSPSFGETYKEGNATFPTWIVGKETQRCLKSTWSKVNDLRNTVCFCRPGINIHLSTQWNCEIHSLKPCNLHMKWNMCTKGKKHKVLKGLRNDSWDAWQNSQKQRDRYSGRDLVFVLSVVFRKRVIYKNEKWKYWNKWINEMSLRIHCIFVVSAQKMSR